MSATPELIEQHLQENEAYIKQFTDIYGNDNSLTFINTLNAIEAYEKTLMTRSRFDDFLEGDEKALNTKEQEGWADAA